MTRLERFTKKIDGLIKAGKIRLGPKGNIQFSATSQEEADEIGERLGDDYEAAAEEDERMRWN